jgi:hypothetical protein
MIFPVTWDVLGYQWIEWVIDAYGYVDSLDGISLVEIQFQISSNELVLEEGRELLRRARTAEQLESGPGFAPTELKDMLNLITIAWCVSAIGWKL